MKQITIFLIFGLITLYAGSLSGRIVGITDGDTVTLLTPAKEQVKIRLANIDAPEKKQPFGSVAKMYLSELAYNKEVTVITYGKDRYKRVIGTLLYNNVDLNLEMVKKGYAWVYRRYCKKRSYYATEAYAKENRLGLWSASSPVRPGDFRKANKGVK